MTKRIASPGRSPYRPTKTAKNRRKAKPDPTVDEKGVVASATKGRWTTQLEKFCNEFLVDCNAVAAAKRAGYTGNRGFASRTLARPRVQMRIRELLTERLHNTKMTVERVLREEGYITFFDPICIVNPDGTPRTIEQIPDHGRRALKKIKVKEHLKRVTVNGDTKTELLSRNYEYEVWDKGASLERMERYLGLFTGKGGASNWMVVIMAGEIRKPPEAGRSPATMDKVCRLPDKPSKVIDVEVSELSE
uniref:Putative terminase n=1 Tax=viral metagenome TaxID=1070528 RepID=A0A6M3IGM4_9ZZZZ